MPTAGAIRAGRAFVELGLDDRTAAGLKKAQARLRAFGAGVTAVGKGLSTLAAAALVPAAISTRIFAGFDDRLRIVRAVTQATEEDFAKLREEAERLGRTTSFTARDVANAMIELGRAGFDPTQILGMTEAMLALAKATDTELPRATEIAGAALRAFNLETDQMGRVTDVLTAGANKSAQTLDDLAEALKPVAPLAAAANEDIEDTVAAIGILANNGIKGSLAGNALARAFKNLSTEAKQTKLREMGVEAVTATGDLRKMSDILNDLAEQSQNLGTAQRLSLFETLFGRGQAAAIKLAASGEAFKTLADDIRNSSGIALRTSKEMEEGVGGTWRRLVSAAEGAGIAIGKALEGALAQHGETITAVIGSTTKWIAENNDLIQTVASLALGAGLLGGSLVALGFATNAVASSMGGLTAALVVTSAAMKGVRAIAITTWAVLTGLSANKIAIVLGNLIGLLSFVGATFVAIKIKAIAMWAAITGPAGLAVVAVAAVLAPIIALGWWATKASTKVAELTDHMRQLRQEGDAQRKTDTARVERLIHLTRAGRLSQHQMSEAKELLQQLAKQYGDTGIRIDDHTSSVEAAAGAYKKLRAAMAAGALTQVEDEIAETKNNIRELAAEIDNTLDRIKWNPFSSDAKRIEEATAAMGKREAAEKRLLELDERRHALLGDDPRGISGAPAEVDEGTRLRERTREEREAQEEAADASAELSRRVHRLRLQQIENEHARQIALVNERYDHEERKAEDAGRSADHIGAINEARAIEIHNLEMAKAREAATELERLEKDKQHLLARGIQDQHRREVTLIRLRYDEEIREALRLGDAKRGRLLAEMRRIEIQRAAANNMLRVQQQQDRIDRADQSRGETVEELRLKLTMRGAVLEKELLKLQRARAIEAAKAAGENVALVKDEFNLRQQILNQQNRQTRGGALGGFGGFDFRGQFGEAARAVRRVQSRHGAGTAARSAGQVAQANKRTGTEVLLQAINDSNKAMQLDVMVVKRALLELESRIGTA